MDDDPLALVKVGSARQWKAISHRLTINFEDLDLDEKKEEEEQQQQHQLQQQQQQQQQQSYFEEEEEVIRVEERPSTPADFKPTTAQQLRLIW